MHAVRASLKDRQSALRIGSLPRASGLKGTLIVKTGACRAEKICVNLKINNALQYQY